MVYKTQLEDALRGNSMGIYRLALLSKEGIPAY